MKIRTFLFSVSIFVSFPVASVKADYQLYGKAHLSSDVVRVADENQFAIGSNGSRLGFKGSEELNSSLQVVWKLESQFDFSGESATLSGRNRYLGVVTSYGTIVGGYQDSPLRTLGMKADVMEDSIADRRSILGMVRDQYDVYSVNRFNLRAKRSLMYVSPRIAGLQLRAMVSFRKFGEFAQDYSDSRTEALTSYSAVYKTRFFYIGAAYENQEYLKNTSVIRYGGGFTLDDLDINLAYEVMDSGLESVLDRKSYGASFRYWFFDTAILMQAFYAADDFHNKDSNGLMLAAGVLQRMSKNVEIYMIAAGLRNDAVGTFALGAADHGEIFFPDARGGDLLAISLGMTYTF
jgi:predicted porin